MDEKKLLELAKEDAETIFDLILPVIQGENKEDTAKRQNALADRLFQNYRSITMQTASAIEKRITDYVKGVIY